MESISKAKWTSARIARLGFLVGCGFQAKAIAEDQIIAATPNNVHRQARRFGLSFRDVKKSSIQLVPHLGAKYDAAAARRGIGREDIIKLLLETIAAEPNLLENVLDDGL